MRRDDHDAPRRRQRQGTHGRRPWRPVAAAAIALSALWTVRAAGQEDFSGAPFIDQGLFLRKDLNEPSGLCYHPARQSLFVVGDEGDIYELSPQVELLRRHRLLDADCEAIAHDPASGALYVAIESDDMIVRVNPDDFTIEARHAIPRDHAGAAVLAQGGDGIEALTCVPNGAGPGRPLFYAAQQSMSLGREADGACLLELELPPADAAGDAPARIRRVLRPPIVDMAALWYNAGNDRLYVISDSNNALYELRRDGAIVRAWPLPGKDQEGLHIAADGKVYLAQDSGGIRVLQLNDPYLIEQAAPANPPASAAQAAPH